MKVFSRFLLSATSPEQFPRPSAPEIAFLGRSNVGKSSLINALLGSVQARVSQTPGRTRAINFFAVADSPTRQQPRWIFADLPGYGYAKISKSISAEWPSFIDPYLTGRETLALCVCLVDSNISPQPRDIQLVAFLKSIERRLVVVGTKADRLSCNARIKAERTLCDALEVERLLLLSAETKRGLPELWKTIVEASET